MLELINKENNINKFKGFFPELENIVMEDFENILMLKLLIKNYNFKLDYINNGSSIEFKKDKYIKIKDNNYLGEFGLIFGHIITEVEKDKAWIKFLIIDIKEKRILSSVIFPDINII